MRFFRMKIGIFGGTFDPVHLGHLRLARTARDQFSLDKIIFIPAFQPPHKKDLPQLTSAAHRYEMVRLAIEGESRFEVSDCEIRRQGISYTFDTVSEMEMKYPGAEIFLLLGKDAFWGIPAWHRAEELKRKVRFLVAKRENEETVASEGSRAEWLPMPLCPISASGIREAIKLGRFVDDYLSPQVLHYIQSNSLYRKNG